MRTFVRYLRDEQRFPWACLAAVESDGRLTVGWSKVHKLDIPTRGHGGRYKGRAFSRLLAVGRAEKGTCAARVPDCLRQAVSDFAFETARHVGNGGRTPDVEIVGDFRAGGKGRV